jgi:hypothetical protein
LQKFKIVPQVRSVEEVLKRGRKKERKSKKREREKVKKREQGKVRFSICYLF